MKTDKKKKNNKLGIFGGVFTPDILTILGVIMYLRLGWVVGNAGFAGALMIILLAKTITICTGLSMSSVTSNIKIGAGGAYSIISKSLGLEAGGSIGIPLYISQTLSTSLYIIGFSEGWRLFFPSHNGNLIALCAWAVILTISYISVKFAIKIQYLIMVIIVLSLVSFCMIPSEPLEAITMFGNFEDAGFWEVFAVFFPAVTGIMAGANMSGELKDPKKAISVGTMGSIFIALFIYVGLAYLLATYIPADILRNDSMVMVKYSKWKQLVVLGILAATFSSALGSMIGAPRILQALSAKKTFPFYSVFAKKDKNNEPKNAIIFTSIIILSTLFVGNFNMLASLITMFFLITYGMLNLVVFIQQSMKIISFRPGFRIPRFVSFFGAVGCLFIMFLINAVFSVVALITIVILYVWLTKKELHSKSGDIRGGMFMMIAERATRIAAKFPRHYISWKPDLLLPVDDPGLWSGPLLFIKDITYPSGSVFAFSVKEELSDGLKNDLENLAKPLREQNILVSTAVIEDQDFMHGSKIVMQTLQGGSFRPNTLFLTLSDDKLKDKKLDTLAKYTQQCELGLIVLKQHPRIAFGMQKNINLWLRDKSPNWHLGMLIALQLHLNWKGKFNLITVADNEKDVERLRKFLERLSDNARLPSATELFVLIGSFNDVIETAPHADMNIFGLAVDGIPFEFIRKAPQLTKSSCLFVRDSGLESALA